MFSKRKRVPEPRRSWSSESSDQSRETTPSPSPSKRAFMASKRTTLRVSLAEDNPIVDERGEATGLLSDDEAAELIEVQPRIRESAQPTDRECRELKGVSKTADVRPSVSGLAGKKSKQVVGHVNEGSDLDSEYDDELDDELDSPLDTTGLVGIGRDIPDDEELEELDQETIRDAERAMDEEADRLLGFSTSFKWVKGFEGFRGVAEPFTGPRPGSLVDYETPYDAFTAIWSKDIMEHIVQETNRYAEQTISSMRAEGTLKPQSRLHQWHDTSANEIANLFAVYMYMGIDGRTSLSEYWMTNDYLEMPKFKEVMTYNRFVLFSKFLHFVDNSDASQSSQRNGESASKKLAKLQPVISHLNTKFSSLYNLHKDIVVDESLTLHKGSSPFVQTIRSKTWAGIKSFELCESHTGYLYKFSLNEGKNSSSAALGDKTTQIVLNLLKDLERRGHCVTMDSFYNSPSLARYLKSLGFDCLGTLRRNRKHVPNDISALRENVEKGSIIARQCGDLSIIAWKDCQLVTMISTYHTDQTYIGKRSGKPQVKPACVRDYSRTMEGVDLKDKKLSAYVLERKRCVKWYERMFKRLLNVSIHNAFILHQDSLRRRGMRLLTHREFRYELAKSLVDRHRVSPPAIVTGPVGELKRLTTDIMHVPALFKETRKRCRVCYRQNVIKKVRTSCATCNEWICFGVCWEEWHTLADLKGFEKYKRRRGVD